MKIYIFVFVCIVLLQWVIGEHDQSAVQESQVGQLVQPQTFQKRSFINKQLRIILVYDEDLKQSKMFSKIKKSVKSASSYWEKTLKVKINSKKAIHIPRECTDKGNVVEMKNNNLSCVSGQCRKDRQIQGVKIPHVYLSSCHHQMNNEYKEIYSEGRGLAPNQLLIVVTDPCILSRYRSDVISGVIVQVHPSTGRPILGVINYCLKGKDLKEIGDRHLLEVIKHQIARILGFHPSVYESENFTSAKPPSVQNISLSWLSTKGTYEVQKTILSLPKMLKEAREHFDCQELQGIELDEIYFSHRIMGNDLMTRFLWESSRVSRITLAYFEDINMYEVDYSMADDFKWGKGLGCDFVLKSCYEYIKMRRSRGQDIQPYCDIPFEQKCASYGNGIGTCALFKHENQLNEVNQFTDDSFPFTAINKEKYGGYSFFDYCPVLLVHSYEKDESSLCEWKSDLEPDSKLNSFLDYRGPDSACFMAKKIKYVNPLRLNPVENIPLCHKFRCPINSGVEVIFGGHAFPCPVDGGIIHIGDQLKNGIVSIDIQCPKCMSLCKDNCPK